jgi:site-specific recombinase XerD
MKNKIVTHFYIKPEKKNCKGEVPIYLRITVNGERSEMSTNHWIDRGLWDKKSQRATGRSEPARIINNYLIGILGKVQKYFSLLDQQDERIKVSQIVNELRGKNQDKITLTQAYEKHLVWIENLIGTDFASNTLKRYRSSLNGLKEFMDKELRRSDIRLCDLDKKFIEAYEIYLKSKKGLKQNSAAKDIKNLCRVISKAIGYKWIPDNPFKDFSCPYVNPPRSYLTEEEINTLYEKDFSIDRLVRVRDLFIFQIYTGLSYVDLTDLTEDSIEIGIDGKRWIVINRKKTGTRSSIPILPRAQEILDKYKEDPVCLADHKILPFYCNQRMNGYLKEIADICGIRKILTTHLARHTFATTVTLSNGVPIETVSKMLGHSDLKTTQIYSKVVDRKVADDMRHLFGTPVEAISQKTNQS